MVGMVCSARKQQFLYFIGELRLQTYHNNMLFYAIGRRLCVRNGGGAHHHDNNIIWRCTAVKVKPYIHWRRAYSRRPGRVCACGPRVRAPVSRTPDNRHTQYIILYPHARTQTRARTQIHTHTDTRLCSLANERTPATYHRSAAACYRAPITYNISAAYNNTT